MGVIVQWVVMFASGSQAWTHIRVVWAAFEIYTELDLAQEELNRNFWDESFVAFKSFPGDSKVKQ